MTLKACLLAFMPVLVSACSGSTEPADPGPGTGGSGAADASVGGAAGSAGTAQGGAAGAGQGGAAGAAQGGAAGAGQGGAAGAAQGGAAGAAGVAGSAGGPIAQLECTKASDCTLVNDCCNCMPLAPGEKEPVCNIPTCFVAECTTKGVTAVECAAGQCVLAINCDASKVLCESLPPSCPEGQVPTVAGACWTGQCMKASYCPLVPSCDGCDAKLDSCVVHVTQQGHETHCVQVPEVCKGQVSCACLGDAVCTPPYDVCSEAGPPDESLMCGCPTC